MPRCRNCKEKFKPKYSSLEKFCADKPQCINAAYQYAIQQREKAKKRQSAKQKLDFNWSDTKWLKRNLQKEVNAIVRSIDRGLPCLATGTNGQIQAGHIFSRGAHTQMRYNLHNIHRQSAYSNNKQSHDGLMQEKLSEEYGEQYLDFLKNLRGIDVYKYSIDQLGKALKIARTELKQLNRMEVKTFNINQRIKLRNQINLKIGLYSPQISIYEQSK